MQTVTQRQIMRYATLEFTIRNERRLHLKRRVRYA